MSSTWKCLGFNLVIVSLATATPPVDMKAAREHWAFQPLAQPAPPKMEGSTLPLDRFVLAGLIERQLTPNAAADKRTLIRRATFDLTGLPPTPEEIADFLRDDSPDAFAKLVDRLLATQGYGERWGRHWLDVARYADTAGDGADYPVREAVKYRDWVVNALNADEPFDQFIREQIAGDILAQSGPREDYARRVTATGFLAIGKRYGYKPSPDYQHLDFADAIDSVGRSLLGLSLGCARCHDHKYDPVTMSDYYALYGIFQSTKWAFPGGEEQKHPSHFAPLVPPAEAARLEKIKAHELAKLDAEIANLKQQRAGLDGGGPGLDFDDQAIGKPPGKPWFSAGPINVLAEAQSPFAHALPPGTRGVRIGSGKPNDGLRRVFAPLRADTAKHMHFRIDFRTVAPTDKTGAYRFFIGHGVAQFPALDVSVTAGEIALHIDGSWEVVRKGSTNAWHTLQLDFDAETKTFSGVIGSANDLISIKTKPCDPKWDGVIDTFICDAIGHVGGPAPERDLDNLVLQDKPLPAPGSAPVIAKKAPAVSAEQLKKLDDAIAKAAKERDAAAVKPPYPVAYGVTEGQPVNARLQLRGEPDKPGDEVPRRFIEILGGDAMPSAAGSGRLELAEWLTGKNRALLARVFVNRVWQWHFGQGLVTTPSDFGLRGERPSHPELLDWLASEFIASGWSLKSLHRLIMTSQTYQRASDDHAANMETDPANRWLWRQARRALDAESIRDAMLAVSGLLKRDVPGEHPFPPVETWRFTIHNPFHQTYDSDHRSLYLMQQRNRRNPYLALFDAADPNMSLAQRLPTTTPTQSLFFMNSPFVQRQCAALGQRIIAASRDDSVRVRLAFEMTGGRLPDDGELHDALAFVSAYRVKTADNADAAWAGLARVLMTSNAFLYVD